MENLFRKAALDKVSSPEQLDLLMQVTSPLGWLALATMGATLGVTLLWSLFGTIPDLVDGQGVLMRGERLHDVKAVMAGSVARIDVRPGAEVRAGQVVAVLSRTSADIESQNADELAIAKNQAMMAAKKRELDVLTRQRRAQETLVRQGLVASNTVVEFDRSVNVAQGELNSLERETALLRARMRTTAEVAVPEAGRVIEVMKSAGDRVREDEPLLRIEPTSATDQKSDAYCGGEVHAILFVPGTLAGKVRPGQLARVSPLDVKKEEYGYIVGRVEWAASYSASPDDMREKLKNDALVQAFSQRGPVVEVRVCLVPDPGNKASGLKWSSSSGPPKAIRAGVQCTASMVVEERRPFTYVIPSVRRTTGL